MVESRKEVLTLSVTAKISVSSGLKGWKNHQFDYWDNSGKSSSFNKCAQICDSTVFNFAEHLNKQLCP